MSFTLSKGKKWGGSLSPQTNIKTVNRGQQEKEKGLQDILIDLRLSLNQFFLNQYHGGDVD